MRIRYWPYVAIGVFLGAGAVGRNPAWFAWAGAAALVYGGWLAAESLSRRRRARRR